MVANEVKCSHCRVAIVERLQRFSEQNLITSGNSSLLRVFCAQLELEFPGLFELIQHPERWIGSFGTKWFPIDPQNLANESLHIEMVNVPLPFAAAVVRVRCSSCSLSFRIVHVGSNFYILLSHLCAYFANSGLQASDLALFIRELMSDEPDWTAFSAPSKVPETVVTSAMAWLLCHEVGHFASPDADFRPTIDVPSYALPIIKEEIKADYMSLRILMHRQQSMSPCDAEKPNTLLAGVALALRAWNLMITKPQGRRSSIHDYGSRIGAATPSPTLRWQAVSTVFDTMNDLGLASREGFERLEQVVFNDADRKLAMIWEKMDEHGIAF